MPFTLAACHNLPSPPGVGQPRAVAKRSPLAKRLHLLERLPKLLLGDGACAVLVEELHGGRDVVVRQCGVDLHHGGLELGRGDLAVATGVEHGEDGVGNLRRRLLLARVPHRIAKLAEVDHAVARGVHLRVQRAELPVVELHAEGLHDPAELLLVDRARVVLVEQIEGLLELRHLSLVELLLLLRRRRAGALALAGRLELGGALGLGLQRLEHLEHLERLLRLHLLECLLRRPRLLEQLRRRHHDHHRQHLLRCDEHDVEHGQEGEHEQVGVLRARRHPRVADGERDRRRQHLKPKQEEEVPRPLAASPEEPLVLGAVLGRREGLVGRRVGLRGEEGHARLLLVVRLGRAVEQRVRRRQHVHDMPQLRLECEREEPERPAEPDHGVDGDDVHAELGLFEDGEVEDPAEQEDDGHPRVRRHVQRVGHLVRHPAAQVRREVKVVGQRRCAWLRVGWIDEACAQQGVRELLLGLRLAVAPEQPRADAQPRAAVCTRQLVRGEQLRDGRRGGSVGGTRLLDGRCGCEHLLEGDEVGLGVEGGTDQDDRLEQEDDHHEEEHEVDVFEEVEEVLGVVVDHHRGPLDQATLDHEVGAEGDEAEHGELAEHRLQDLGHHRRACVLQVMLDQLEDDRDRNQHDADPERHLHVKRRVDVVAIEFPTVAQLTAVLPPVLPPVLVAVAVPRLGPEKVAVHVDQHENEANQRIILELIDEA
mmetsp:Transcript_4544/g.12042  ORF Transcript_4544/g.12042 Transcript_4544/m.12042 type:complete len:708 (-) Transcript_4544:304-2427(-)